MRSILLSAIRCVRLPICALLLFELSSSLFSSATFAASSCPSPTKEVTYSTCPVTDAEISVRAAPFCATGGGSAAYDDTYAFQNALNAALACHRPVVIPAGYYYISKSLYLYGHGGTSAQWQSGAEIRGTGLYSVIEGDLTEPYPVFDATGYDHGKIQDLAVNASGQATAGLLLGANHGTNGNTVEIDRVSIGGGSIAAVVDLGSDLLTVNGSNFNGQTGIVITAANVVNIKSKFNPTLVADGASAYMNGTLATINDSILSASTGAGIRVDGMDAVTVTSSYIHLGGTATSGVEVTAAKGSTRGNSLNLYNLRCESSSTAAETYFVNLQPGASTTGGTISGVACTNAKGLHLPVGSTMLSYNLNFGTSGHMPLIDGDVSSGGTHEVGALVNSVINSAGSHGFLGNGSMGNSLLAYYIGTGGWAAPVGAFNSTASENLTAFDTTLQVNGPILPAITNTHSLGDAAHKFTAVYSTGGVTQTSDVRQKKNIANSDLGLDFITKLRPVSYRWKSGSDTDLHYGLIAQETEKAVNESKIKAGNTPAPGEQIIFAHDAKTDDYGLKYSELISPLIKAIQELDGGNLAKDQEIDKLRRENAAMKAYLCGKDPAAPICR